jgi:GT2 family glycosyltransferase
MKVTAIIPHWNRRDLLASLLDSLKQQTRPFDCVLVVDNGSEDDSAALAEQAGAQVLRMGGNLGFATAVNRGIQNEIQNGDCDWIAILNNDVRLQPDWLSILLETAEREKACFATGKTLSESSASAIDGTFDEISRGACAWRCGAGKPDSPVWNQMGRIRMAPMTAALFHRTLFDTVGLLDESFGSYLEDVDFGLRCAVAGRSGIFVPQAVAYHRGSASGGRWHKDTVRLISRNQVLLARKHFRGQPVWPIVVGQLLWGLVAFRHGRFISYLLGKMQGLGCAPAVGEVHVGEDVVVQPQSPEIVRAVLEESERHIFDLQRQTGFDSYWRAYFWLLPL